MIWQCPEPHTGSSGTPIFGANERETQSYPSIPGAVTCIRAPFTFSSLSMSGFSASTSSARSKTHSRSRARQTSDGRAPRAWVISSVTSSRFSW